MIMEENQKRQNKHYIAAFILAAAGVLLDQWSKYLAVTYLKDKNPIDLIPGIFQLTYLENRGAAFGILQGKQWFFYISTFLVMGVVIWIYMKIPVSKKFLPLRICAILIVSGAIGNLIDRIRLQYVIDFFYFKLIDFPVFNVADIFVTVSTILLLVLVLFYYKEEDFEQILYSGRDKRDPDR